MDSLFGPATPGATRARRAASICVAQKPAWLLHSRRRDERDDLFSSFRGEKKNREVRQALSVSP